MMVHKQNNATEEGALKTQEVKGNEKDHFERSAGGTGDGASGERSTMELDVDGLDTEESPQEVAADEGEETTQVKRRKKREWVLTFFSLLVMFTMVIGSVFLWARYFASEDGGKRLALNTPEGVAYELKPFFVPLNSNTQPEKFLKTTLVLELFDDGLYEQIERQIEDVRGNIFKILIGASPENIGHTKGKSVLAEKIVSTSNLFFGEKVVKRIFFKDALVI